MKNAYHIALYHSRRIPKPGAYEAMIIALLMLTGNRRRDGSVVYSLRG